MTQPEPMVPVSPGTLRSLRFLARETIKVVTAWIILGTLAVLIAFLSFASAHRHGVEHHREALACITQPDRQYIDGNCVVIVVVRPR
jgi:phosphate/sulfate permease